MPAESFRQIAKHLVPEPARKVLRGALHYGQRVSLWPVILDQVRGTTWRDQRSLLRAAAAAPVLAWDSLLEWQDPILLDDADVRVAGVGRFQLRKRCDDLYHVLPAREPGVLASIAALQPGDTFVDAGANIGFYTVLAAQRVGPKGRVVCVEMMPDTADRLETHVRLNALDNVTIVRAALSDVAGETVRAVVTTGKFGQASIAKASEAGGSSVDVQTATLDFVAKELPHVTLLKMDLEGAELPALRGGGELLQRTAAVVYESWGAQRAEENQVDALLLAAGFQLTRLDGNNWIARRPER